LDGAVAAVTVRVDDSADDGAVADNDSNQSMDPDVMVGLLMRRRTN